MTAFWAYFEQPDGPSLGTGFLWERSDGAVRDSAGKSVPHARVTLSDQGFLVYRDTDLDRIGINASGDGNSYSTRISDAKPADLVKGGLGSQNEDGTWSWTQYCVLPRGAHNITVELADPASEWGSATMSDGWVAVVANTPRAARSGDVIRSITYSDADGKLVTYSR